MGYTSVVAAVVRALAAEVINSAGGCDFEAKVQAAAIPGAISSREAAFLDDCWVFGRLHKQLSAEHWNVLCAKYSTHMDRKHAAITAMARAVQSPAPERFRHAAVVTWALPKLPGKSGKRSTSVLPEAWYCMDNWSDEPVPIKTQERWRRGIRRDLERAVDEALASAQELLDIEGLIRAEVA